MAPTVQIDAGPVEWPALVVHGGAGTYARVLDGEANLGPVLEDGMGAALDAGWAVLVAGGDAVAAVVAAVASLENHGNFNAGLGSVPNTAGVVEMDAAVMDGAQLDGGRAAGAVAGLTSHSAVLTADAVRRQGQALLLAGPPAEQFAAAAGIPELHPLGRDSALSEQGTVGAVAVSADGRLAAASSTGGRPGQPPGRVGDSPIPGAGVWADPVAAVTATGYGEAFVLAGFSRLVATHAAAGSGLGAALTAGLDQVHRFGGTGGGIALGSDRTWAAAFNTRAMARGLRHSGGRRVTIIGT